MMSPRAHLCRRVQRHLECGSLRAGVRLYSSSSSDLAKQQKYCSDLTRQHDHESYLCSLFLPRAVRPSVHAVLAYNVELAKIPDSVSELNLGRIRMQWWRDAIEAIYSGGNVPQHPVAMATRDAVAAHRLSKRWLMRILDEREKALPERGFATLADAETYGENTQSSLLYLTLEAAGVRDVHADHAASHLGKAGGLVRLLRGVAFHTRRRKVLLPMDLLVKHGLSQEDVLRNRNPAALHEVAYEIASAAHVHLSTARGFRQEIPRGAIAALLPAIGHHDFLGRIQKLDFDLYSPKLLAPNPGLPWRLAKAFVRRQY